MQKLRTASCAFFLVFALILSLLLVSCGETDDKVTTVPEWTDIPILPAEIVDSANLFNAPLINNPIDAVSSDTCEESAFCV
ncbi:hypothetical protein FACS1894105_13270 [Clostridia bacterium]|nr:hypothetical protein FACS1894105_13270 [Clostridia bacterium]